MEGCDDQRRGIILIKILETGIERLHEQEILKREWALQMNRQREEAKRSRQSKK